MIKIIMIRVESEDYDAWLKTHYDHVEGPSLIRHDRWARLPRHR